MITYSDELARLLYDQRRWWSIDTYSYIGNSVRHSIKFKGIHPGDYDNNSDFQ